MNDLAFGIIDFDGLLVGKETTLEELKESGKFEIVDGEYSDGDSWVELYYDPNTIELFGKTFYAVVSTENGKITGISLEFDPILDTEKRKKPTKELQQERFDFLCERLREEFGEPTKIRKKGFLKKVIVDIAYDFDWGEIATAIFLKGEYKYQGGGIHINYKNSKLDKLLEKFREEESRRTWEEK